MTSTRMRSGATPPDRDAMRFAQCATPPAEEQPCESWYESSWELQAGLTVFEDVDITIPAELLDD